MLKFKKWHTENSFKIMKESIDFLNYFVFGRFNICKTIQIFTSAISNNFKKNWSLKRKHRWINKCKDASTKIMATQGYFGTKINP